MLSSPTTESLKIVRIIESTITYSDIELLSLLKKNYNLQLERICNHPDWVSKRHWNYGKYLPNITANDDIVAQNILVLYRY